MVQIDMAFIDKLERDKKAEQQKREEQRPQIQIDNWTRPICEKVGHHFEIGPDMRRCVFCGRVV